MKKFWQITGTQIFGQNKVELKKQRDELNTGAGIKIAEVPANQWVYKITKGPEHPNLV